MTGTHCHYASSPLKLRSASAHPFLFRRRYEKAKKPLSAFEADIQKYRDLCDEIAGEDAAATMRFLRVECGPLKQALTQHCEQWTAKFT